MALKIAAFPADMMGCGQYRVIQPVRQYAENNDVTPHISLMFPEPQTWKQANPDVVVTQRPADPGIAEYWRASRQINPEINLVVDIDDLLWQPHPQSTYKPSRQNILALDAAMAQASRLVASTEPLKFQLERRYRRAVMVRPNCISLKEYRKPQPRAPHERLRIVWAGSDTHLPDLEPLIQVVEQTAEKYDWHFMGYIPPALTGKVQFVPFVPFEKYLSTLAEVGAHVGIAPLADNLFNECKSNLKLIEYGALGLATIASEIEPYRNSGAVMVRRHRPKDWLKALSDMEDEQYRQIRSAISQSYAKGFILEESSATLSAAFG